MNQYSFKYYFLTSQAGMLPLFKKFICPNNSRDFGYFCQKIVIYDICDHAFGTSTKTIPIRLDSSNSYLN